MTSSLGRLFNIYPGEARLVSLMLLYSFALGLVKGYFFTAASALFLEQFSSADLSYVFIAAGVVIVALGTVNARLQTRLAPAPLLTLLLGFLVALLLAAWLGVALIHATWLVFSLLVLYRIVYSLSTFAYWSLAGYLFDVRQSKRLFGLIDSGEMVARVVGGMTLPLVISGIGTVNLILVAALALVGCLAIQLYINRTDGKTAFSAVKAAAPREFAPTDLRRLLQKRYILLMVAAYMVLTFTYYMIEFLLYQQTQQQSLSADDIAAFLGVFLGWAQLAVFITKLFVSGRLLGRFGVRLGVLAHPAAYVVMFAALALTGTALGTTAALFFYLVLAGKVVEQVIDHGLSSPTFRVLYKPLPPRTRVAAQALIEVRAAPLAVALAGVALLIFAQFPAVSVAAVVGIALLMSIGWTIMALLLNREYRTALAQALTQRLLVGADLELEDGGTIKALNARLQSHYPGEVIYALDILEEFEGGALYLVDALTHPAPEVRQYTLARLAALHYPVPAETLLTIIHDDAAPAARTEALRTFCTLYPDRVVDSLEGYLQQPDAELRLAAMVGFLRHGDIEGIMIAGKLLLDLVDSPREDDRIFAARVLGETAVRSFYRPLVTLIDDESLHVRRAVLHAAGRIGNPALLPPLVAALDSRATDYSAVKALSQTQADVFGLLAEAFQSKPGARRHIARILGRRGDVQAIPFLRDHLAQPDRRLREEMLKALQRLGYRADTTDAPLVAKYVLDEAAEAARLTAVRATLDDDEAAALLRSAIDTDLKRIERRVFLLLALLYDPATVMSARDQLALGSGEKRAYALEALDVLLAGEIKPPVMALIEDQVERLHHLFPQPARSRKEWLQWVIANPDGDGGWLQATALYALGRLNAPQVIDSLAAGLNSQSVVVTETALWVLNRLKQDERKAQMLLTVEKVIILKTVDLFSRIEDDLLAEVAAALRDEYFEGNETIFNKGDAGNCMYVIVEGAVRIHDGSRTLNELGPREIFGELALLDAEVRSASATTRKPTTLLRLDQDIFYELLRDQSELAMGIIRMLTLRLRRQISRLDPAAERLYDKIFGKDKENSADQ